MKLTRAGKVPHSELKARIGAGHINYNQSIDVDVMEAYPAWELFHFSSRPTSVDWKARWDSAGGRFYNGRMIALKTDQVWEQISNFGLPYPPFDDDDVMELNEIGHYEATLLGLMSPGQVHQPPAMRNLKEDIKTFLTKISASRSLTGADNL